MKPTKRPPPVVVAKRNRSTTATPAPRQAPRDGRITAWRDDLPPPQPALPPDKAEDVLLQAELEVHYARMRLANDPDVLHQAAEKLAVRDQVERQIASILPVPNHPLGKGYLVFARSDAAYGILGKALRRLFPKVTFINPKPGDARVPSSLKPFIKTMRKERST